MNTVRIWFTKTGEASYISLLDLQRVMGRALKRSGLPVWYTLGFNPHIYMTFTCPLSLGQESLVESVDCKTEEEAPGYSAWQEALNQVMPSGIQVFKVGPVVMKPARIASAEYQVRYEDAAAPAALGAYNALPSAPVIKKTKRGEKTLELKEYIPTVEYAVEGNTTSFTLRLPAGDGLNLNPTLLTGFLAEKFSLAAEGAAILRTRLLTAEGEDFQ
ncbi:MAG: TIGR03936 family radical SAM-associated protein [Oscillospiraceae bacterium]|nr:TIGR03936 family radical SAM-associated protein [Oscillospiraceae bacterium]MDY5095842.1 TIGR03936 family radical SAM-associated protein [Oscillospiraceae bacterium]